MQVVDIQRESVAVRLTAKELIVFNNALNEICNGIEVPEFATRIGAELPEVKVLLTEIHDLIDISDIQKSILDSKSPR